MLTDVRTRGARLLVLVVAIGATATLAAGVTFAATSSTGGYTACAKPNGALRLLNPKGRCPKGNKKVKIGARGPAGAKGPQGKRGAQGIQGVQGTQGIQGVQGLTGNIGPQGPAGVITGYYDYNDAPDFPKSDNYLTLATLSNVPPGSYAMFAKLYLVGSSYDTVVVSCKLVTANDSDLSETTIDGNAVPESVSLELVTSYSLTQSVTVQCDNTDEPMSAEHVKIVALPINSVVRSSG